MKAFKYVVLATVVLLAVGCAQYDEQFVSYCVTKDTGTPYVPVNGSCPYQFNDEVPK